MGANCTNCLRRTSADKRRCVEIALTEFTKSSNSAIAKLCGVGDQLVASVREQLRFVNHEPEKRVGLDGKQYPAHRNTPEHQPAPEPNPGPPDDDPFTSDYVDPPDEDDEEMTTGEDFRMWDQPAQLRLGDFCPHHSG